MKVHAEVCLLSDDMPVAVDIHTERGRRSRFCQQISRCRPSARSPANSPTGLRVMRRQRSSCSGLVQLHIKIFLSRSDGVREQERGSGQDKWLPRHSHSAKRIKPQVLNFFPQRRSQPLLEYTILRTQAIMARPGSSLITVFSSFNYHLVAIATPHATLGRQSREVWRRGLDHRGHCEIAIPTIFQLSIEMSGGSAMRTSRTSLGRKRREYCRHGWIERRWNHVNIGR